MTENPTAKIEIARKEEVKPGYKTSEFWLTASVAVPSMAAGLNALVAGASALPIPWDQIVSLAAMSISAALTAWYASVRTRAKMP